MGYDCVIIGAGLSGLAAGIRLAHFGKNVCICEQHTRIGGMNSYYSLAGHELETGLHAITNFAAKSEKSRPLNRLLRQLRIPYDALMLREQNYSEIRFPGNTLRFTNDFDDFAASVRDNFPKQIDGFLKLDKYIREYNELDLQASSASANRILQEYISSERLREMLRCPVMYYGSATADDMDFTQFALVYKSIFHDGLSRPAGDGIRTLLNLLKERFLDCGGELRTSCRISGIETRDDGITLITSKERRIEAAKVLSSAGLVETMNLCESLPPEQKKVPKGELSYLESMAVFDKSDTEACRGKETIIFFNTNDTFIYRQPKAAYDTASGIICFPAHFQFHDDDIVPEPSVRVSTLANHKVWENITDISKYKSEKQKAATALFKTAEEITGMRNIESSAVLTDLYTPLTITRFTGRHHGSIYGSPHKLRDGRTHCPNLFICGADQGFHGITGAMLSGITIANLYLLV